MLCSVVSERCDASRLKVVLRNGGCPEFSGGRSDSPYRGIPQQHIMRLWWNQSLASCGWWLVGDLSVRLSVRPSVRPYTCYMFAKRASALVRIAPPASTILIDDRDRGTAATITTRHYWERIVTEILAPKRAPNERVVEWSVAST